MWTFYFLLLFLVLLPWVFFFLPLFWVRNGRFWPRWHGKPQTARLYRIFFYVFISFPIILPESRQLVAVFNCYRCFWFRLFKRNTCTRRSDLSFWWWGKSHTHTHTSCVCVCVEAGQSVSRRTFKTMSESSPEAKVELLLLFLPQ